MFEPADKSPQKRRALARLEALIRRALVEGWTRERWRSQAAALAGSRRKAKRSKLSEHSNSDAVNPWPSARDSAPGAEPTIERALTDPLVTPIASIEGGLESRVPPAGEILGLLEQSLDGSGGELRDVAERLEALCARIAQAVAPSALFSRTEGRLVVYLDRLDGRPVDAFQRSALIKQAELVLSAARRAVAA